MAENDNKQRLSQDPLSSQPQKLQGPTLAAKTKQKIQMPTAVESASSEKQGNVLNKIGGMFTSTGKSMGMNANVMSAVGNITGGLAQSLDDDPEGKLTDVREGVRGAIGQMGPIGAAISAATGIMDSAAEMLGVSADVVSDSDAKELGLNNKFDKALSAIPGLSMLGALAKKQKQIGIDDATLEVSDAYGDSVSDIQAASNIGGKSLVFGGNGARNAIAKAERDNNLIAEISRSNSLRKKSDYAADLAQQNLNRYAGQNYQSVQVGRSGLRIMTAKEAHELLSKPIQTTNIQAFAEGGKMNILPEGALHARLNNLKETGEEVVQDVTKKGIPVVAVDEDGKIEQVAEIEKNELILTKELTDFIEAMKLDGSDGALIEIGKRLSEELITNLDDKQGEVTENE